MVRLRPHVAFGLVLVLLLGVPALAEEEKKKEEPRPPVVSDEEAAEALKLFKVAFKAKGYRGDEKIAEQDYAMRELAVVQHPKVVDALAKQTKNRNVDVRTGAVLQLGKQRALPAYAGKAVVAAMKRHAKDDTFVMAGLEAIGELGYLGAFDLLKDLMKHHEYAVLKNTLVIIGELKDVRFIEEIFKLLKELKLEKGAKWDGVSVTYDTGTAGTHDQEMAEAIGRAQEAKNKKKGKKAARSQRDLGPIVLMAMKALTGEEFSGSIQARKWLDANAKQVKDELKAFEKKVKDQEAELK
jgi:hypothetical protein